MFETLSKNSGRCNGAKPASDNRLRASDHSVPTRRPPLVPDREDHQFACRALINQAARFAGIGNFTKSSSNCRISRS